MSLIYLVAVIFVTSRSFHDIYSLTCQPLYWRSLRMKGLTYRIVSTCAGAEQTAVQSNCSMLNIHVIPPPVKRLTCETRHIHVVYSLVYTFTHSLSLLHRRDIYPSCHQSQGSVIVMSVSVIVLMVTTVLFSSIIASLVAILVARVTASGYKKFVQVLQNISDV